MWEQRADFGDRTLHLLAADNTEFTAKPVYSYEVIESKAIDVVFGNRQLGSGKEFMKALEDNVLETRIYDLIKEESRKYITDTLMATGGSLKFERRIQTIIDKEFEERGLKLKSFSAQLLFSKKVTDKIDQRNEVNTNVTVIDQKIIEQKKQIELELLVTKANLIHSEGITENMLKQQAIEGWIKAGCPMPQVVGNQNPATFMLNSK